jgi:hypothetical protein
VKPYVALIACVLLAAALVFFGLCHRYTLVTAVLPHSAGAQVVFIRVDKLTGKTWRSYVGRDYNSLGMAGPMDWTLLEDSKP